MTDNCGNVLEEYEYNGQGQFQITNASGTVLTTTGIGNNILFTGREFDAETGNYFYRARYYNPTLGRFISRDPLSGAEFSQGTNLYAYVRNNFLNASDPMGTCLQLNLAASLASFGLDPNSQSPANGISGNPGNLAYDEDGNGNSDGDIHHRSTTSGAMDQYGNIVPPGTPGSRPLDGNSDVYGEAPLSDSTTKGGTLQVGDMETFTFSDGTQSTMQIGDFGPNTPEMSVAGGAASGLQSVTPNSQGPEPSYNGVTTPNIPVQVQFYPELTLINPHHENNFADGMFTHGPYISWLGI